MPVLSFEGETHDEIVRKVRRWLASLDSEDDAITVHDAIDRASELTKDALTIVAQSAPGPVARSEIFKALTRMGYEATDATRQAMIGSLDALADATEGSVVKRMEKARNSVLYEMNAAVAKQVLRSLKGK